MKGKSSIDPVNADELTNGEPASDPLIEQYCIFYNDFLNVARDFEGVFDLKLINFICLRLKKQSKGITTLTNYVKEQAAKEIDCSERSINRAIDNLKKHHVLIPMTDSSRSKKFYVNPLFIWKGDIDTRIATIKQLGLKTKTVSKTTKEPKGKAKQPKVKRVEIDFTIPHKERRVTAHAIVKELQRKHNYPDPLCEKFWKYYSRRAGETEDRQKIMEFEREALKNNREFPWEWKLSNWQRTERPDKLSKAEEQNRQLQARKPYLTHKELFG
jgi:hypothetical protein